MKQLNLSGRGGAGDDRVTVEGVLERITYVNPENGWTVVRVQLPDSDGDAAAVGHLPGVQPGETLRLTGCWQDDPRHGRQLKVESFVTVQPATLIGMEKYLGSGLVRGIGKVMAGRLVGHFGLDAFEVIEEEPGRLTEVEGIGPKRKARIVAAWQEQRAIKQVMLFLQSHGVSPAFAVKIYKRYGEGAVGVLQENPYRLAVDIFGIGFRTADAIALNLGLPTASPRRAEAGLLYALEQQADEGHLFCPLPALLERAAELLTVDAPLLEAAALELAHQGRIMVEQVGLAGGSRRELVYLRRLHRAETGAALLLRRLLDTEGAPPPGGVEAALLRFQAEQGVALADQQQEAVRRSTDTKALVITGGPGTGKTTIVNAVIGVLEGAERRILLCAPTGRAAKRLSETTGREATTVHRMLEYDPRQLRFARDEQDPLRADVVIVDEVSMVDASLFFSILRAVPPAARLILVGDVDQLPSVGPGSVLGELIRSGAVPVVRLTEIFRQAQKSLIVVNAHRVNRGLLPLDEPEEPPGGGTAGLPDYFFIKRAEPEGILDVVRQIVAERLPQRFGVDPRRDIQVLTPMRKGMLGTHELNRQLQQLLNPRGESVVRGTRLFRVGDKVMQLRNNYDLDVYNGDIGQVQSINLEEREAKLIFDGRAVTYDLGDMDELDLGYACTIHKSQGSEYPVVVIPLHTQHYTMLRRNLLYTALTRGKRVVVLVGSRRALSIATSTQNMQVRSTRMAELLGTERVEPVEPESRDFTDS